MLRWFQPVGWRSQSPAEWVLRAWLGVTFTYAGVQKLTDPNFFDESSSTFIGAQLRGFAEISPLGPVLDRLAEVPVLAGAGVAVTEIVIGLATLFGVAPALAAGAGFGLSVVLWLTATWNVHPYFLGSDTIYAVAWLAYLLALPPVRQLLPVGRAEPALDHDPDSRTDGSADPRRRALAGVAALAAGALALAGISALIGRARRDDPSVGADASPTEPGTTEPGTTEPGTTEPGTTDPITTLTALRSAGAVEFDDPGEGAAVVVAVDGGAVAFALRCTHRGCTAAYDRSSALIACPCHGSRFDPAGGGRAVAGPATRALTELPVRVDANGAVRRG